MPLEGCIVVLLEPDAWYVCMPSVATPGEYTAGTSAIKNRRDALKVRRELNELEPADYSDLTKKATWKPSDDTIRHV